MNKKLNFQPVNMKMICAVLSLIMFLGCRTTYSTHSNENKSSLVTQISNQEHMVQSVLWQQRSSEYIALCYQAFNSAQFQIEKIISQKPETKKPLAIITDIDETLLNNSPFNAKMIKINEDFSSDNWIKWGEMEEATPVPGALAFLKYAESKGIQIYYISNRLIIQEKETMNNLKKIGFPFIDEAHMLLKDKTSGKEERRLSVSKDNTVIMLLGDNLSDFTDLFENKSTDERNKITENLKNKFGTTFIVLPNPMYGDWETKGIYEGKYDWSPTQKDSIRKAKLISY